MDYGDRIIIFSDGVSQSGMGSKTYPLGWRRNELIESINKEISENQQVSARQLSQKIVAKAKMNDMLKPKDDITCAVIYFRKPRNLLIVTGPPIDNSKDVILKERVENFQGKKIISGGTTANIMSREFNKEIKINFKSFSAKTPPESGMEGVDLITEGMLTLSQVADALEKKVAYETLENSAVKSFIKLVLNSDIVNFLVGTKINEAHQDPNIPFDLGIRRTIIKRIAFALENIYLKEIYLEYI
jgi:hypothetical protein